MYGMNNTRLVSKATCCNVSVSELLSWCLRSPSGFIIRSFDLTDTWKSQVVVQVGDILDRGEDEIAILSLLRLLDEQAKANGGAVFQVLKCFLSLTSIMFYREKIGLTTLLQSIVQYLKKVNGNHETINVEGDFRYVDTRGFDECIDFLDYLEDYAHDFDKAFKNWIFESRQWKKDRESSQTYWDRSSMVRSWWSVQALTISS